MNKGNFIEEFNDLSKEITQNAIDKGFWEGNINPGEKIVLMHSELSEAVEALRENNPGSEKIPGYNKLEEEFADCIIKIMDYGYMNDLDIAGAIIAKMKYNKSRPYKHGKKF